MRKTLLLLVFAAMAKGLVAQTTVTLKTAQDSASYAYGIVLANSIKRQLGSDLNREVFVASLNTALKGDATLLTQEAATKIFDTFSRAVQAKAAARVREEGKQFLEENKKRREVTTTASGLQYEVLKRGTGTVSPKETDKVEVHYHGTLINGDVFDSSVDRGQPAGFPLNRVIKGWTEGVQYMKEGDKFKFFIPSDLAYGERGAGDKIKPGATLIFEVELLKIQKSETVAEPPSTKSSNSKIEVSTLNEEQKKKLEQDMAKDGVKLAPGTKIGDGFTVTETAQSGQSGYKSTTTFTRTGSNAAAPSKEEGQRFLEENKKRKEVTTTTSGLQYEILKHGTGTVSPKATDRVEVHYHGTLINGEVFDSSVERGQPATFGLNQVIKGWTEGVQYMKEGDKFKFFLPSELAYGERSAGAKIKPGSTLVFEVELLRINPK